METNKFLTIKEAANMLGVTALTLRNWDKNNKLKALRHPINNYRVYKKEDIERLIEDISRNTTPAPAKPKKSSKRKLRVIHLKDDDTEVPPPETTAEVIRDIPLLS